MTTNFEITDNYAVSIEGRLVDLHNNFDLTGFYYHILTRQFEMQWNKASGDWVAKNELNELTFIHKNVTYLFIDDNKSSSPEHDSCLAELSFFPSDSRDVNDVILLQPKPETTDDIVYYFESGRIVRVCCEVIELIHK